MGEADTDEAVDPQALAAFVKARDKAEPRWMFAARANAAEKLLAQLLRAANRVGIRERHDGHNQLLVLGERMVVLRVRDDVLEYGRREETGAWHIAAIDFDPIAMEFVGRDEDTSRHPIPGGPKLRRTAVAVVAEEIARLLTSDP